MILQNVFCINHNCTYPGDSLEEPEGLEKGIKARVIEPTAINIYIKEKEDITYMGMSDPIADMLTRIRNANAAKFDTVLVPTSKMKVSIAQILKDEGYIENYEIVENKENNKFKDIKITLKYTNNKMTHIISGIEKISKPGLRKYSGKERMPQVLNGLGIAIVSTNQGVMTDKEARKRGIGGEILAYVY